MVRGGRESASRDAIEWARMGVAAAPVKFCSLPWIEMARRDGFDVALTGNLKSVTVP